MSKEILINSGISETRVAIIEDGRLVEFSMEYPEEQRRVGNIYRGKVENVLPGMQAAFIDIGEEKNAFIYVDDVTPKSENGGNNQLSIENVLRVGQEITVQMVKEPMGTKGARVVGYLTIPGRYLVLTSELNYVGVSRKIESEAERERLKDIVGKFKAPEIGVIVRTLAESVDAAELQSDYEFLIGIWKKIQKKLKKGPCPSILYRDHDLLYRILRDYLTKDVTKLLIDDYETCEKARELVKSIAPSLKNSIELYSSERDLFAQYGVESQLNKALKRKVWLDCGAYLVFDQTEALTVIDVNTGKFVGNLNLDDTVFRTNLEAAEEIAHQIRLRNLAGIIIIDFIDMASDVQREKVIAVLSEELKKDRARINVLGFTSLGLLEMTRKKVKQSLREMLQTECRHCEATGYVASVSAGMHSAIRQVNELVRQNSTEALLIAVNPQVASMLIGPGGLNLERLEQSFGKTLYFKGKDDLESDQVRLLAAGDCATVEREALPVSEGQELELKVVEAHIAEVGDGIARLDGYVIDIEGAAALIGKAVRVKIVKTYRTYAKATMI